jgi:hypothetical protein
VCELDGLAGRLDGTEAAVRLEVKPERVNAGSTRSDYRTGIV